MLPSTGQLPAGAEREQRRGRDARAGWGAAQCRGSVRLVALLLTPRSTDQRRMPGASYRTNSATRVAASAALGCSSRPLRPGARPGRCERRWNQQPNTQGERDLVPKITYFNGISAVLSAVPPIFSALMSPLPPSRHNSVARLLATATCGYLRSRDEGHGSPRDGSGPFRARLLTHRAFPMSAEVR